MHFEFEVAHYSETWEMWLGLIAEEFHLIQN